MKQKSRKQIVFINIVIVLLIILAAISVLQGVRNAVATTRGSFDFQYDSSMLLRLRINPYDESLHPTGVSEKFGLYEYYDKIEANQFPSLLSILIPLTYLSPHAANVTWVAINLLSTAVIIFLSKKLFFTEINNKIILILSCCMLAGLGWRNNIGNGQHTIFAFAFFLIALWLSERKKAILSGIALALSFFKYTLTVPLALYFLYKKRYKELVVAIGIHLAATPICAWWLNDSVVNMVKKPLEVSKMLSSSGYIDFGSVFHLNSNVSMLLAVLVCGLMLILSLLSTEKNEDLLFSILSFVSLIVIYHRTYDFFILIVPVGIFVENWMIFSDHYRDRRNIINMVSSILIFIYANFAEKVIDVLGNRLSFVKEINPYFTTVFAILVYLFVVYLIIQYLDEYRKYRYAKKEIDN